jgi:transposase
LSWLSFYAATIACRSLPARSGATCICEALEGAGARLRYQPPNSLDFNPIKNAFSKLIAILRKAAARIIDSLWDTIWAALPHFSPADCINTSLQLDLSRIDRNLLFKKKHLSFSSTSMFIPPAIPPAGCLARMV